MESFVTRERDRAAALQFIKKAMERHGRPKAIVTDGLRSYGAAKAELRRHGVWISVFGKGNCYDNAMVETFFETLNLKLVWRTVCFTQAEAEGAIGRYIDSFYNPVRRHPALDFVSPAMFQRQAAQ